MNSDNTIAHASIEEENEGVSVERNLCCSLQSFLIKGHVQNMGTRMDTLNKII